jgi:hypothetical protein
VSERDAIGLRIDIQNFYVPQNIPEDIAIPGLAARSGRISAPAPMVFPVMRKAVVITSLRSLKKPRSKAKSLSFFSSNMVPTETADKPELLFLLPSDASSVLMKAACREVGESLCNPLSNRVLLVVNGILML